ncbi:molecular chaperone [Arthrobacter sp. NPDC080086]|uniref:fimbrial biogenesis chaperone n=1 Tax=Arthrobacter sp. NPDC080086 TaxID=3155917 RepID=UPI00344F5DAA
MSILPIREHMRRLTTGVAGVALALAFTLTHAANFTVTPVRVELSQQRPSAALTVKNEMTDEPVVVELRTVAWTQNGGEDTYAPAQDLLATPPIFTLAPGATQVIRVGLRHPPADDREVCYRLFLREVPPPPKPGFAGVQIALEMRLPVFAKPRAPTAPQLKWRAEPQPDGAMALAVTNDGTAHAQVANLVVTAAGVEKPVGTYPEFAYVLPGQTRRLLLKRSPGAPALNGGALHLKAYSDAGDIDSALAPETR